MGGFSIIVHFSDFSCLVPLSFCSDYLSVSNLFMPMSFQGKYTLSVAVFVLCLAAVHTFYHRTSFGGKRGKDICQGVPCTQSPLVAGLAFP